MIFHFPKKQFQNDGIAKARVLHIEVSVSLIRARMHKLVSHPFERTHRRHVQHSCGRSRATNSRPAPWVRRRSCRISVSSPSSKATRSRGALGTTRLSPGSPSRRCAASESSSRGRWTWCGMPWSPPRRATRQDGRPVLQP